MSKGTDRMPLLGDALVERLVGGEGDGGAAAGRASLGALAGATGIACNVALSAVKGAIGLLAGSVSVVADAFNNATDAASGIVSLIGFKLASRPADEGHPFGHGRYEYIAGSIVAALVLLVGVELVSGSVRKILDPQPVAFSAALVAALVVSILVKLWLARFNRALGERISSSTLIAAAVDARNDVVATSSVLACAVASRATGLDLDGWAGLGVGLFVAISGIGLIRETADLLIGAAPSPAEVEHIRQKILGYEGILDTHDLMLHDYGPDRRFASAHVEVSSDMDVLASHDLLDRIERDFLREERIEMTLHMDPIVTDGYRKGDLRAVIADAVREVDPRLTIHDLHVIAGDGLTSASFHCVRPAGLGMSDDELAARIFEEVAEVRPDVVCRMVVDDGYLSSARLDAATLQGDVA